MPCPFDHGADTTSAAPPRARSLPGDGTPLTPSPSIAAWREDAPAVPLAYDDGHVGLVVTRYDAARAILADPRFSQLPHRIPVGPGHPAGQHPDDAPAPAEPLDDDAHASIAAANLLALDGEQHQRMRRGVTSRFSVKQARMRRPWVHDLVASRLDALTDTAPAAQPPATAPAARTVDLFHDFAQPVAAATHCAVIGVPDDAVAEFESLFVGTSSTQAKFDFIRRVVDRRVGDPGEDVVTDLLAADFTRIEVEGLVFQLMSAGRDSVAYLIATATVALLTNPDQAALLREDPTRVTAAVEEFMRTGAMFLTLFPRTATEDVDIEGVHVAAGRTVSVSPVGANRDPERWDRPDSFEVERDAFGHLGFGHGPHGCVGQQLARVEISEAITQLFARFPELRLVDAEQTRPMPFANPIATYEAGAVHVELGRDTTAAARFSTESK